MKAIFLFRLMRSDVLASAVLVGVEDVVKTAQQMFNNWMNNGEKIPPNLREVVYLAGKILLTVSFSFEKYCYLILFLALITSQMEICSRAMFIVGQIWWAAAH